MAGPRSLRPAMLRPLSNLCFPLVSACFCPTLLPAQMVQGGDVVMADFYANGVFRITPAGQVTSLFAGPPLSGPADVAVDLEHAIFIADFNGDALWRLEDNGTLRLLAGGLGGPIRLTVDHDGALIVACLTAGALRRVTQAGSVSLIAGGFTRPFAVAVEPDGNYLVTEDTNGRLYRVERTTGTRTLLASGLNLVEGVALLADGDYAVASGNPDYIDRLDRTTGQRTRLVGSPPLGNPCDIEADFAGGLLVAESGLPAGNRLVHVDSSGALTVITSNGLLLNPEGIDRVPHLSGPTVAFTGPGAAFELTLDFPGEGGRAYKILAAQSVFPGQALGSGPRGSMLNRDPLFLRTRTGDFPPYTGDWTGRALGPNGRARASLDLSSLPPGALAGTYLHIQCLTLDPSAPHGVRSFSNTLSLRF